MAVHWNKYFIKFNGFYGSQKSNKDTQSADIHAFYQQKKLINPKRVFTVHRHMLTLYIDLSKSEEMLRKEMNRTTRYQINKGKRANLSISCIKDPNQKDIEEFAEFFAPFAKEKGISPCGVDKLISLMENNMLIITYVYHNDGRKLASHLYIVNDRQAIMFHSCSGRFENEDIPGLKVSSANRYLHWHDILFFKNNGYDIYDFMGLTIDPNDKAHQNINNFKKGFGGEEINLFMSYVPQTIKGKLLVLLLKFLWRDQQKIVKQRVLSVPMGEVIQGD